MEGVKVALEANAVEVPPTRYPSKGVSVTELECSSGMNVIRQD